MRGTRRAVAVAAWGVLVASTALARIHQPAPQTAPAAYLVVDADTGTVLAERDAHRRWPPASMTKMMTVLLAMERVQDGSLSLDEPVRTSAWASRIGGSQVYLAAGETFPLGEMLKAIMIASANDAAVAVAGHIAGAPGLKTGYYHEAGFSITATATRNDLRLIAVVLGVPTKEGCFAEAARLMNETFASYRMVAAAHRAAVVSEVPVAGGTEDRVKALATGDLVVLVKRAEDRGIVVEARVPRLLQAPVRRSQPLGDVVIRRGDEELGKVTVVADRDVEATGWLAWLWNRALSGRTTHTAAP